MNDTQLSGCSMGGTTSSIGEELMCDYLQLTYLSRQDILKIYRRLASLNSDINTNLHLRFPWSDILSVFPELKVNPFADRLASVFSSQLDSRLSFEDMLDMCSALAPDCPAECKAKWALKLFDFNDSNSLEVEDIVELIDRLTIGPASAGQQPLDKAYKQRIAHSILSEIDLDLTNSIVTLEFVHAVSKIADFHSSFTLKL